jgi:hypothetical protein
MQKIHADVAGMRESLKYCNKVMDRVEARMNVAVAMAMAASLVGIHCVN